MELVHKEADARVFRKHLLPGERIEWVGRPGYKPGPRTTGRRYLFIALVVLVAGLAALVYALPQVAGHGGWRLALVVFFHIGDKASFPRDDRLIGTWFLCVIFLGLALVGCSRILFSLHRALTSPNGLDSRYALTGRRAMLMNAIPGKRIVTYDLRSVQPEVTRVNDDGSGVVLLRGPEIDLGISLKSLPKDAFDELSPEDRVMLESSMNESETLKMPVVLADIPNPGDVRDLILRLQRELPSQSS